MRSARLTLALDQGVLNLPPQGRILILNPSGTDDLSALPREPDSCGAGVPAGPRCARGARYRRDTRDARRRVCSRHRLRSARPRPCPRVGGRRLCGGCGRWAVAVDGQKDDGIEAS